jgi:hypothetical protein
MLGKMPAMLRGILEETFASQHDMMLVGLSDSGTSSVSATVAANRPDVLIVGVERQDWANGYVGLFVDHPHLHILAIGDDARSATMHELYIRRWRVAELSPPAIVAAVRASRDGGDEQVAPFSNAR